MEKEKVINYLDVIAQFSREFRAAGDEQPALTESEGEQVVDYQAVSDFWAEEQAGILCVPDPAGDPVVDYQAVSDFWAEEQAGILCVPDPAGDPVVDYEAVSKWWKEKNSQGLQSVKGSDQEGD